MRAEERLLKRAIRERAANASSYLSLTLEDVDALRDRAAVLPDDTEVQSLYTVTTSLVGTVTEELEVVTKNMEDIGLDPAEYRAQLIAATGSISRDLFTVDVATDLLGEWTEIITTWIGKNGAQLVFDLLLFVVIILCSALSFQVGSTWC